MKVGEREKEERKLARSSMAQGTSVDSPGVDEGQALSQPSLEETTSYGIVGSFGSLNGVAGLHLHIDLGLNTAIRWDREPVIW